MYMYIMYIFQRIHYSLLTLQDKQMYIVHLGQSCIIHVREAAFHIRTYLQSLHCKPSFYLHCVFLYLQLKVTTKPNKFLNTQSGGKANISIPIGLDKIIHAHVTTNTYMYITFVIIYISKNQNTCTIMK